MEATRTMVVFSVGGGSKDEKSTKMPAWAKAIDKRQAGYTGDEIRCEGWCHTG
jgi:hypothetical protein